MEQWNNGNGTMNKWKNEKMKKCNNGTETMEQWNNGAATIEQWKNITGSMKNGTRGMEQWNNGTMEQRNNEKIQLKN